MATKPKREKLAILGISFITIPMNSKILSLFFLVIFLISLALVLKLFWPFFTVLVLALILVSVFFPWYETLYRRVRHATIASLLACFSIVLIVILPLSIFLGLLSQEAFDLFVLARDRIHPEAIESFFRENTTFNAYRQQIEKTLQINLSSTEIQQHISSAGTKIGLFIYEQARTITSNVIAVIFQFILLIFILFYFFRDGKMMLSRIMDISPLSEKQELHIIHKLRQVGSAVFWGNLASSVLQGGFATLGFLIFGPRGSVLLMGLAVAIMSLVPAVGPLIVFIPGGVFLLLTDRVVAGIGLIIYGALISNLIDNIIRPKMIENKIKIHPLLVFFSILGGVQVFGILGILYGPLIVTIFLTLLEIYQADFLKKT